MGSRCLGGARPVRHPFPALKPGNTWHPAHGWSGGKRRPHLSKRGGHRRDSVLHWLPWGWGGVVRLALRIGLRPGSAGALCQANPLGRGWRGSQADLGHPPQARAVLKKIFKLRCPSAFKQKNTQEKNGQKIDSFFLAKTGRHRGEIDVWHPSTFCQTSQNAKKMQKSTLLVFEPVQAPDRPLIDRLAQGG